jgi:hypothetical protein
MPPFKVRAKITDDRPEFGANDKGELTVAEFMRHEAGRAARLLRRERPRVPRA